MWTPNTGYAHGEMGDIEVFAHQDRLHLFHLCLPSHDAVAHLVSDDGIHWQTLPTALRTGDYGAPDDDQIWTMGVFELAGRFFMLYTGLDRAHLGLNQCVCLATSTDLIHWTKHPGNPVMRPDPRWYEDRLLNPSRVDWRDPFIFHADGEVHCLITARTREGDLNRRACIAHATSRDGFHWEQHPPLLTPNVCFDLEVPTLFPLDGRWYFTSIFGSQARQGYRVADDWRGPWRRPADDSTLPGRNYAVRMAHWRGQILLFHWHKSASPTANWYPGPSQTSLCLPKLATSDAAGNLILRSFPGLDAAARDHQHWDKLNVGSAATVGFAAHPLPGEYDDLLWEASFTTRAPEFGMYVRGAARGDVGTFITCLPHQQQVQLYTLTHLRTSPQQFLWRGRELTQSFHHRFTPGQPCRLRVVCHGPEVEVSVDGKVVLCALTMPRRAGEVGLFVEDGSATCTDIAIARLPTWNPGPFASGQPNGSALGG